ncbi:hypothetical protein Tco_0781558, partial [Tanacetum coccineum]
MKYHPQTHILLRSILGVLQIGIKSQGYGEPDIVMSDSEDSTVTYTAVSSPFRAAFQAPPSPYYVSGPEYPPSPEFVHEPVYLEFMSPEDDVLPAEEQPLPAAVSPTTDSPGYVPDSNPEEDPEEDDDEDSEEDPADYPTDRDDDEEEEEPSGDEADDEEEDEDDEDAQICISEAWDRFKDLLRKCPHHGFSELHQIDTFYNALTQSDQDLLNAAAGGNLLNRTPRDALTIIENKSK